MQAPTQHHLQWLLFFWKDFFLTGEAHLGCKSNPISNLWSHSAVTIGAFTSAVFLCPSLQSCQTQSIDTGSHIKPTKHRYKWNIMKSEIYMLLWITAWILQWQPGRLNQHWQASETPFCFMWYMCIQTFFGCCSDVAWDDVSHGTPAAACVHKHKYAYVYYSTCTHVYIYAYLNRGNYTCEYENTLYKTISNNCKYHSTTYRNKTCVKYSLTVYIDVVWSYFGCLGLHKHPVDMPGSLRLIHSVKLLRIEIVSHQCKVIAGLECIWP